MRIPAVQLLLGSVLNRLAVSHDTLVRRIQALLRHHGLNQYSSMFRQLGNTHIQRIAYLIRSTEQEWCQRAGQNQ